MTHSLRKGHTWFIYESCPSSWLLCSMETQQSWVDWCIPMASGVHGLVLVSQRGGPGDSLIHPPPHTCPIIELCNGMQSKCNTWVVAGSSRRSVVQGQGQLHIELLGTLSQKNEIKEIPLLYLPGIADIARLHLSSVTVPPQYRSPSVHSWVIQYCLISLRAWSCPLPSPV